MRIFAVVAALIVALSSTAAAAAAPAKAGEAAGKTRVIVLGVDHGTQLVSRNDQPGMLTAFLDQVRPDAICIERPPEQAARGDYYEYTYEVQGVILPYAARTHTALCPIDWMPPVEDQKLGFGLDLDTPLELRRPNGFQGFLSFPEANAIQRDFFAADDPANLARVVQWAATPAPAASQDLPRRLYLYRTFMQAQRIRAAAAARPGKTVLVVIGYFHKPDIEANLAKDPAIDLVQPSSLGRPDPAAVAAATTTEQLAAILAFNLLGVQADSGNVDWAWVADVLAQMEQRQPGPATSLLRIRYDLLTGTIDPAKAARRYAALAADTPDDARFAWTGVEDKSRVDSFFDPFGNLSVRQRALVEQARCLFAQGQIRSGDALIETVARTLPKRQAFQLTGYAARLHPKKG
ncbi:MAG: hypothetical protein ACR2PC_15610 [Tsuneonella suprasediminis]|nr:hypothetical protein LBX01_09085 [Altererythrobacter sp. N1]